MGSWLSRPTPVRKEPHRLARTTPPTLMENGTLMTHRRKQDGLCAACGQVRPLFPLLCESCAKDAATAGLELVTGQEPHGGHPRDRLLRAQRIDQFVRLTAAVRMDA